VAITNKNPKSEEPETTEGRFGSELNTLLYRVKTFILAVGINVLLWYAIIEKIEWAENIVLFYTWSIFVAMILIRTSGEATEKMLKSYRDGKHLPAWMGYVFYLYRILLPIAFGWTFTGFAWLIVALFDINTRNNAKEKPKEQEV